MMKEAKLKVMLAVHSMFILICKYFFPVMKETHLRKKFKFVSLTV